MKLFNKKKKVVTKRIHTWTPDQPEPQKQQLTRGQKLWKNLSSIILVVIFVAGICLLLYPTVANWWNHRGAEQAISTYERNVQEVEPDVREKIFESAMEYNKNLAMQGNLMELTSEQQEEYNRQLSLNGDEMMGYLEIPKIEVSLPIYHGTEERVLSSGIGHVAGTSLPVGGEGTHCVLSGHRGLPSAKLLTDLDTMEEGDCFMMKVFGQTLYYEIDQILIVLPEDMSALAITSGMDYCTLVTCTPYGINTHRLLVRGHRIDEPTDEMLSLSVSAEARRVSSTAVASIIAAILLLILLIWLLTTTRRRKT